MRLVIRCVTLISAIAVAFVVLLQCSRIRPTPVPILTYHRIGDDKNDTWWVTPSGLRTHLHALAEQGYTSVLPEDVAAHIRWGRPLPRKPIMITFDGGYLGHLLYAEPALKEFGFRAVCHLPTGRLYESPENRKSMASAEKLAWTEVIAMHHRGVMVFGGYAHTERNLAVSRDVRKELERCYRELSGRLGVEPVSFAYPNNQLSATVLTEMRRSGFSLGCFLSDEVTSLDKRTDPYKVGRIAVKGGYHRFEVDRLREKETAGEVRFRARNPGPGIAVSAKLGGHDAPRDVWVDVNDFRSQSQDWSWEAPSSDGDLRLEIWDSHRIIRLYPQVQ